jgi:hypothetical protein
MKYISFPFNTRLSYLTLSVFQSVILSLDFKRRCTTFADFIPKREKWVGSHSALFCAQRPVLRAAHGRLARIEPTSFIYMFLMHKTKTVQDYKITQAQHTSIILSDKYRYSVFYMDRVISFCACHCTVKKRLAIFPSPAGIYQIIPGQGEFGK